MRSSKIIAIAALGIALVIACKTERQNACSVDTDCAEGSFCRSGYCATPSNNDGGIDGEAPPGSCTAPGGSCNVDDDCCVKPCNAFKCGGGMGSSGRGSSGSSGTSGTSGSSGTSGTTSGGNCAELFGQCAGESDCCAGLTCSDNACR